MKELLIDCMEFKVDRSTLNESLSDGGKFTVKGVLQRAESKNQNGRIYPYEILLREAKKYDDTFVKQKRAVGELDHPDSGVVNLKNVSHNITRMWWEGKDLMGEMEILTTPSGNILKELFKCGITVGISSRGMGSVKKINENTVEVDSDYEIIAFDCVSSPSTLGAFLYLNESVNSKPSIDSISNKWTSVEEIIRNILSEIK